LPKITLSLFWIPVTESVSAICMHIYLLTCSVSKGTNLLRIYRM
jgi:hypothetical protein